jgi:hypothetical protein
MDTSKPRIVVIGGGINGRMVQHFVPDAFIYDWGSAPTSDVPQFHGANYLWEPIAGLPCRKMKVITTIDNQVPYDGAVRRYKERIGKGEEVYGVTDMTRILNLQFPHHSVGYELERYPPARIQYDAHISHIDWVNQVVHFRNRACAAYDWLVSTIPLPSMLRMVGYTGIDVHFRQQPVKVRSQPWTLTEPDKIYVNYITDPERQAYRETFRNGLCQEETLDRKFYEEVGTFHTLTPGKIWDTPRAGEFRSELEAHNIVTFGRYGAWSSDELVHMTVGRIQRWATGQGLEVVRHA